MNDASEITHALILVDREVQAASAARHLHLMRPGVTAIRGPIALSDTHGQVFGVGIIEAVEPEHPAGPGSLFEWRIAEVSQLSRRFVLQGRLMGPLWARLSQAERLALVRGPASKDEIPEPAEADGWAPEETSPAFESGNVTEEVGDEDLNVWAGEEPVREFDSAETPVAKIPDLEVHSNPAEPETGLPLEGSPAPVPDTIAAAFVDDEAEQALPDTEPASPDPPRTAVDDGQPEAVSAGQDAHAQIIEAARARALAYVPDRPISDETARTILVNLRETEIKLTFPDAKSTAGILRKTFLDRLIDEAVESRADFERLIPREVRMATDTDQVDAYLEAIVHVLAKIR